MRKWIVGVLASVGLLLAGDAPAQLVNPIRLATLQGLKVFIYEGFTNNHAEDVAAGEAQPIVYAEVGSGDLPVSYYHYRVPTGRAAALAAEIPLPPGFSLAKIRVVGHTAPQYWITLTVYEVAGERRGLRAEWTTYVRKDGDAKPRVMMLDVWTSEVSVDPVEILRDPVDVFAYERAGDTVSTQIVSGSESFSSTLVMPRHPRTVFPDVGWNAASDILYWTNGVADLKNVNGLISNRRVPWLAKPRRPIENRSRWAPFVQPHPRWVLLFEERIDEAIRPWVNVTDPDVPLDPVFRDQLIAAKATIFSENEMQRADDIAANMAEPLTDFFVEEVPPSVFLNFEILPDQIDDLLAAIPFPETFELTKLRTLWGEPRRYYLSLNVYETVGIASGQRAEWSIYVLKDGDPVPRYMILEAQSSTSSLDPVDLFTRPALVFDYSIDNGVISVDVQAPGTSFQATIPLPASPVRRTTALEWTEANNLIYWRNGVADKIYYSGLVYDEPMIEVPPQTVTINDGTKWAPFLRLQEVLVFENPLEFIASPWTNLNALEDEILP